MDRLHGKVAIITGAARGQGASEARQFILEGAKVVMTDVSEAGAGLATDLGENAHFLMHDVTDERAWKRVVDDTVARFGRLDILVNNAGVYRPADIAQTSVADFDMHYRVNQLGVFLGMQASIEPMSNSGGGSIVNISSGLARRGSSGRIAYAASKWAVRGMGRAAALELAGHRIRVNTVMPGIVDTPMLDGNTEEFKKEMAAMVPLGRIGSTEEVAELVTYLASDNASYISGGEFVIDGGISA
ncbi:MAG: glucose 1-dehydrogenase [Gammaproteobacteria bacterium]|nr:glucose 1-dehydrogenase [Gammaproteobacteria bacterium]MDH3416296.1 glucose 1-dehydrogenase [Gammaproteobacteria bacterium]